MKRSEFNKLVKNMLQDIKDGYYGQGELLDEIWSYIQDEQSRNKDLWKEVKRLRFKYEPEKYDKEGRLLSHPERGK